MTYVHLCRPLAQIRQKCHLQQGHIACCSIWHRQLVQRPKARAWANCLLTIVWRVRQEESREVGSRAHRLQPGVRNLVSKQ